MSVILNQLKKEAIIFCPLCNKEYRPVNLRAVEEAGETVLAHSHCPICQGAALSLLFKDMVGITLIGMATDLGFDDAVRVRALGAIDEDDVLQIYQILNP